MKRTMVMVGLMGLGFGPFAAGVARADTARTGATVRAAGAAPSTGDDTKPVAIEQEEMMSAPFTVESIDRANRRVVVESPDGARSTVNVSPNAPGFDTLKRGDQVELDYYKSSVLSLAPSPASATLNSSPSSRSSVPAPASTGTRALKGQQVTTSARVTRVDNEKETIQVTTPDGRPQTLYVQDPALQRKMLTLKPGDEVQVTYTEPTAVGLRRAAAK